ncbi:protease SohB [Alteromonas sp. a30]|uniref:protease SohB n=1 Tax=Alteromonas sp. a30 TaxID=2730917 RepID=UPI002281FFC1|nr:protease SohB [Alteromonas sp. a30]MCY7294119.1 protease SohB [Alteromonas sp. a30]
MEFLSEYGMFLLKAVTIVVALLLAVGGIIGLASKQKLQKGELQITSLSDALADTEAQAREAILSKDELKAWRKAQKKASKDNKAQSDSGKIYVIDFKGSMDAHEVESLRNEVSTVINLAEEKDEVLLRLESPGGVVHGYGLAASQLQRLRDHNIHLTASVDMVAASGGYMMACVANKIIAAPFSILGSIGVIAQLPNFNKLLKHNHIEFEQHTAGDFKRTVTMFGENNDSGREKFKQELEEIHEMFKTFVSSHRPELDIKKVATGETWHGTKAKDVGLVDDIQTSDDFLLKHFRDKPIFKVEYRRKPTMAERLSNSASLTINGVLSKLWEKNQTKV